MSINRVFAAKGKSSSCYNTHTRATHLQLETSATYPQLLVAANPGKDACKVQKNHSVESIYLNTT